MNTNLRTRMHAIALCLATLSLGACAENYDKELAKKPCELLTPEMVASTLDVPADKLKQHDIAGRCMYKWKGDGNKLEAKLSVRVFKDTKMASTYFKNATTTMTKEQGEAAISRLRNSSASDRTKKIGEEMIRSKIGKKTSFEGVDGLGDEAVVNTEDGELWVRKSNLYFILGAYKGPKMPSPKSFSLSGALQAAHDWEARTVPQRKKDATALAHPILQAL